MTPKELATAYAETINGPANGWGQHVHKTLGRSDFIMHRISQAVGNEECGKLIDKAMKKWRADRTAQLKAVGESMMGIYPEDPAQTE